MSESTESSEPADATESTETVEPVEPTEPVEPVESVETADNRGQLVCVTGASGFIGSHVVRELLERGYRVRATVRDASDERKVAHLRRLAENAAHPLELFSADILDPRSFDEPFAGCAYICHVAASVKFTAKDPQTEIVDVAVKGTENALEAAARAGTVKRFVLTSSIAAVCDVGRRQGHVYTEADWNRDATVSNGPYQLAKTQSERHAWAFVEERAAFDLIAINPAMVIGPVMSAVHTRSSPSLVRDLLVGKFPAAPAFHFGFVDVRDVANAHVAALEQPSASGRYILYNQGKWLHDISAMIRARFPSFTKAPRRRMPNALMYVFMLFDKRLSYAFLRNSLGVATQVDAGKAVKDLGLELIPVEDSVAATCQSLIDCGLVDGSGGR